MSNLGFLYRSRFFGHKFAGTTHRLLRVFKAWTGLSSDEGFGVGEAPFWTPRRLIV